MLVFFVITVIVAVWFRFCVFQPPGNSLKKLSSYGVIIGWCGAYAMVGIFFSATLFLVLVLLPNPVPERFMHVYEWDTQVPSWELQSCDEHENVWRCNMYGYSRDVSVRETKEVASLTLRNKEQRVSYWIIFLSIKRTTVEVLFPIGGLERYYLDQLRPAQEKVSEIERKLHQVREFYARSKVNKD